MKILIGVLLAIIGGYWMGRITKYAAYERASAKNLTVVHFAPVIFGTVVLAIIIGINTEIFSLVDSVWNTIMIEMLIYAVVYFITLAPTLNEKLSLEVMKIHFLDSSAKALASLYRGRKDGMKVYSIFTGSRPFNVHINYEDKAGFIFSPLALTKRTFRWDADRRITFTS